MAANTEVPLPSRFYKLGLIGYPVSHSLSPPMHRAAISFCGLDGTYELLPLAPEELVTGFAHLVQSGYSGLNVTVPHKQAVIPLLTELTAEAARVRAVNTISIVDGGTRLIGHNTDLEGFVRAVQPLAVPCADSFATSKACVLGGGGAARAAVWGLIDMGFGSIDLLARNRMQSEAIVSEVGESTGENDRVRQCVLTLRNLDEDYSGIDYSLIVNSTKIGLANSPLPGWLMKLILQQANQSRPHFALFDMVYAGQNATSPLVQFCREHNVAASDGLGMLIEQAVAAFQFWTGERVAAEVMRNALDTQEKIGC